ncbi:12549_t:CDS:2 [Ambispora leptoticha]|uniref:12549_t:CDS:1 n=1 Tax=Ambispora leptoticha TaxID=144679 RepID=A0A9N9BMM0_9GLOM|nr:12549_t:CDS:2 [Ambispora leptoticha]
MSSSHKKPTPLSPTAARTVELTNTRAAFRTEFEESLGCMYSSLKAYSGKVDGRYNAVKLEEGVYFQYPDNIELEGSLYRKAQAVLKEIISSEPELAQDVKSGKKDLEALEEHPKPSLS